MTKHGIEIPDLPEGWRAVAYRNANTGEFVIGPDGVEQIRGSITKTTTRYLIVEKIKPRRVVLEDTQGDMPVDEDNTDWIYHRSKWWRIVEEEQ